MASMTGTSTVIALFDSASDAEKCVRDLRDAGVRGEDISLVATDHRGKVSTTTGDDKTTDGTSIGENVAGGALFGGLGGLLIGLGALAIPGIGPIVAAGPIATTLAGAGIGAVGGGIIGAIKDAGVPDDEAQIYAEGIRRGGTLVSVHSGSVDSDRISDIMDRNGAVDIDERGSQWRSSGWSRFDENAGPYQTEMSGSSTSRSVYDRIRDDDDSSRRSTSGTAGVSTGNEILQRDRSRGRRVSRVYHTKR